MLSRIKKNDLVSVISGKDKGKQGVIINIDSKRGLVLVKDVAVVKKHLKARKSGEKARIASEESYISVCKVMPVCRSCKKACRVQTKKLDNGQKVRICHRCKEAIS